MRCGLQSHRRWLAYSPVLNSIGFFEDFFDNKQEAAHLFWQTVNQHLILAA
jgi:hypothetical protein